MKTNKEKFIDAVYGELSKRNQPLMLAAAESLASDYATGYCEVTECALIAAIAKPFVCEYCNKFHDLKDCGCSSVEEYRRDPAAWALKYPPIGDKMNPSAT